MRARALPLLVVLGCSAGGSAAAPRLLLSFERPPGALRLEYLRLTWVAQGMVLADERRVPAQGTLPASGPLGSFEIELRGADVWRTVIVDGLAGRDVVAQGAVHVFVRGGQTVTARVAMEDGRLPDRDRDGLPDVVDDCPLVPNPAQAPCGTPDAAPPDAASPDGGPVADVSPADAAD